MRLNRIKIGLISAIAISLIMVFSQVATAKDFLYVPVSNATHVIDCDTDTIVKTITYNDYIIGGTFSPDGKRYYLNAFHSIYVIDTTSNSLIDTLAFSSEMNRVTISGHEVSNDGKKLYLSAQIVKKKANIPKLNVLPPQLIVYDLAAKKMVKNYTIPSNFTTLVRLRNDDNSLILLGQDLDKINLKTGKIERLLKMQHPDKPEEFKNILTMNQTQTLDNHGILAQPYYDALGLAFLKIDTKNGKVSTLRSKDLWFAYTAMISNDKKHLYTLMDELIKVDNKTGETVKFVPIKTGTNYNLASTSDGKKIYVGPAGADISVYDAKTLELLRVIPLSADGMTFNLLSK